MRAEFGPSLPVNQPLSERVAREVRASPHECFRNATLGLLFSDALSSLRQARYVEGKYYNEIGIPFDHAWLELDGEIIDPTFTAVVAKKFRTSDKEELRRRRAAALRALAEGYQHRYEAIARYTYEEVYAHRMGHKGALPMTPWNVLEDAQMHALGLPAGDVAPG